MAGAQGLGQGAAQPGQAAMPMGVQGYSIPDSVQRMPGGFGLSPQLLQMIAGLQQRSPQFTPNLTPKAPMFGGPRPTTIQNPYNTGFGAPR